MGEKNSHLGSKRMETQQEPKIQVEEQYFRHVDQIQRWRNEYDRCKNVESKISSLSKFHYQPVDYAPFLERIPYKEMEIPNFDYLIAEAKALMEKKFVLPLFQRIAVTVALLVLLLFSGNLVILWLVATLAFAALVSIYLCFRDKQRMVARAMKEAEEEGIRRRKLAEKMNDDARREHERKEDERIKSTELLLSGDIGAIILKIDAVMPKLNIPFPLQVDIEIYERIPLIKVLLPPKAIIPLQTCELIAGGRPQYEDKDSLTINKQYLELCAATIAQIISALYVHIPSFDRGYAHGLSKDGYNTGCLFNLVFEREQFEQTVNTASSGVSAMQMLQAVFDCDPSLALSPFEPPVPPEWENVAKQDLRSINVKINWATL